MSALERYAVDRVLKQARAAGVPIPPELEALSANASHGDGSYPARAWAEKYPDEVYGCCDGDAVYGPRRCTCWEPVYQVEQAEPRPPRGPGDLKAQPAMCGDCAFRPGSQERADDYMAEALYESVRAGTPFWCHSGMRRPLRWVHPDGREVDGAPDDWQPPIQGGIPYQADGTPGLLCAGGVAVAAHTLRGTEREDDQEA